MTIDIKTALAIAALFITMIGGWVTFSERMARNEALFHAHEKSHNTLDVSINKLEMAINRLSDKLDRKVDK